MRLLGVQKKVNKASTNVNPKSGKEKKWETTDSQVFDENESGISPRQGF